MGGPSDRSSRGNGSASSRSSIAETILSIARSLLEADCYEFLVQEDDHLIVRASSRTQPPITGYAYPLWTGIPGRSFSTGRACVIEDLYDVRSASAPDTESPTAGNEFRSMCCVPIGGWGLLLAKSLHPGAFDEQDRDLVVRLAEVLELAFDQPVADVLPIFDGGMHGNQNNAQLLQEIGDILSHDLINLLTVVKGNLDLAEETGDEQFFDQASIAIDRIEELIDEVVFLARTGELVEQLEPIELSEVARDAWDHVQPKEATLVIERSVAFRGSRRGVIHLLENLIDNSITHANGDVAIRIGSLDDGFYLEDDGPGIPAEHREEIFERGYTIAGGSSGLGLHIVKRIAHAHGWTLRAELASTGGARFEIGGVDTELGDSPDGSPR